MVQQRSSRRILFKDRNDLSSDENENVNASPIHPKGKVNGDGITCSVEHFEDDEEVEFDCDDDDFPEVLDKHTEINVSNESDLIQADGESELNLNASETTMDEEQLLLSNPGLKKLFNKMLDDRIRQANQSGECSNSQLLMTLTPNNRNQGKSAMAVKDPMVKSPSDTTIYVPAFEKRSSPIGTIVTARNLNMSKDNVSLHRRVTVEAVNGDGNKISKEKEKGVGYNPIIGTKDGVVMQNISNFVEAIRRDQAEEDGRQPISARQRSEVLVPGHVNAKSRVEQVILEAEKFRAAVATPPGMANQFVMNVVNQEPTNTDYQAMQFLPSSDNNQLGSVCQQPLASTSATTGNSDDEIFHLICHIEEVENREEGVC